MKTLMMAATALAALGMASAASAQQTQAGSGWYVRGDGGATFSSQIAGANGPHSDTGWVAGAGVGRELGNFRVEGQFLYLDNTGKNNGPDTKVASGFVNGYYDFLKNTAWRPFVGVGVGVANVKVDGRASGQDNDTRFAYQVQAGVAHPFTDHLIGEVAYHYIGAPGADIGSGPTRINGDYTTSAVTVGLRYAF